MEVDRNLIDEFKELERDSSEFKKKCMLLAQELTSGHSTAVQLVEQLGPLLVDVTPYNRELGMWILTYVLENVPLTHFDTKQLEYICAFYTDRLKDNHQVIPAVLAGILALSKFDHFPEGAARQILTALFQNVACQQQQEGDRRHIYQILDKLLEKCGPEIAAMGLDYVYGVISAIDGERNPRNLLLLFNWFPKFCKNINLGHLSEEAFEVLACYFPVDFKAPPNDTNQITRDDLADALAPCLTSIPAFADFCLPLALEKLDSSLELAQLDALKLLELGCVTFDTSAYVDNATEIWSALQKQLLTKPNQSVETACLNALTAVIKKISGDHNQAVKDIADTLKGNLFPNAKLFEPSVKILLAVAKASREASTQICKEIVPILLNAFNISGVSDKVAILRLLIEFYYWHKRLCDVFESEEVAKVPVLCLRATVDADEAMRRTGFGGLSRLCQFLTTDVRRSLYTNLQALVTLPQTNEFVDCFAQLARFYPNEVDEHVIGGVVIDSHSTLRSYLDCLSFIVSVEYFTNAVVTLVLNYIQDDPKLGQVAVNSLRRMLGLGKSQEIQSILNEKNTTTILVDWCLKQNDIDVTCLDDVAFVLKLLIGNLDLEQQKQVVSKQLEKITDLSKQSEVFLLYGILCRVKRDVVFDYKLLNELTYAVQNGGHAQDVGLQLLANLINKCQNDVVLMNYLAQIGDSRVVPWVTKALVMRNHVMANVWTDKLIDLLDTNATVAVAFRIVMDDNIDALSPQSNCIKTLLYQQKFFNVVSNRLCDTYQTGRESYLVAFAYLLDNAPRQAVLLQFNRVLKLMIICLDQCKQSDVLVILLRTINNFLVTKEKCVEEHFSEFLNRFLNLSTFDKSMKVRILALKCLQNCVDSLPVYKLLPHKNEVLRVLGKVVDDRKRMVRKEAVDTRSMWFLLDAPT